ncbi:MAG: dihydrolipoamide acetyltransferase family protein [Sorangiineae bacterium]|nr:dihydrolipoamide acetyltransferase family protein [Polyangiaceae bacterium]MEB2322115.1 dihydrolipoamide acetyltransferase family protein [Sorangiineae bacterium]
MAKFEFKLPDIGEGVTEGEIVAWLVKPGDKVAQDQEMVEVMTDKATVTIGAPRAGIISALGASAGDLVPVGHVLVVFDTEGGGAATGAPAAAATPAAPAKKNEPAATAVGDIKETLPGMGLATRPSEKAAAGAPSGYHDDKPLAAPATRKLARELGVDLKRVPPSGEAGRVTREDVERFAKSGAAPVSAGPAPSASPAAAVAPARPLPPAAPVAPTATETRVPIKGVRRRIYENMARSKHTAAHFTYVDECDVTALRELRERTQRFAAEEGLKLSFLPFIVKAVVAALKKHPALNCLVDDASQEMVLRHGYDIGIAAATEAGLMVPVVRDADRLSVLELAREIQRLGEAAKDGRVQMGDLGGSSFTITSLGKLGGLFATPIVNYPEVAILGVHEMKRKPVVRGDEIVIGEVMLLSLSFDHRIIDGHVGAAFAQEIIGLLEEPDRLLVSMS